jgi:hypothetical protein
VGATYVTLIQDPSPKEADMALPSLRLVTTYGDDEEVVVNVDNILTIEPDGNGMRIVFFKDVTLRVTTESVRALFSEAEENSL